MPQTAYHLFFRFHRNLAMYPSLQLNEMGSPNKERHKEHIRMVLNANMEPDSTITEKDFASQAKFLRCSSFSGMSKNVAKRWKSADPLVRSAFKDLAKEEMQRHKKQVFESYQSFTKSLPKIEDITSSKNRDSNKVKLLNADVCISRATPYDQAKVQTNHYTNTKIYRHPAVTKRISSANSQIKEVDMSDEKIMALILKTWGGNARLRASAETRIFQNDVSTTNGDNVDLYEFLSGIDWN